MIPCIPPNLARRKLSVIQAPDSNGKTQLDHSLKKAKEFAGMSQLQCSVLGLNWNFPRAVLHGPMALGGLGIPSADQKITRDRVNYFLFNNRRTSTISSKFDISVIYIARNRAIQSVSYFFLFQIWSFSNPFLWCSNMVRIGAVWHSHLCGAKFYLDSISSC